jgi:antitoxin MazE
MLTRVRRWGNSLGLRIPSSFAAELGVDDGSPVDLTLHDGEIRLRPLRRRRYSLGALLDGITERNRHDEIDFGLPRGREGW